MRDLNQTPAAEPPPGESPDPPPAAENPAFALEGAAAPVREGPSVPRGLVIWLIILVVFGVGGVMFGEEELALLAALSGVFVAARAADRDEQWRELYFVLGWVVPAIGFALSGAVGFAAWKGPWPLFARGILAMIAACAAGLALLSVATPVANAMARGLFHEERPGHLHRLSARCVVLAFALAIPGWFAAQQVIGDLLNDPSPFMDKVGLGGGLIGYVLLAFAGAGFLMPRSLGETARRLGLRVPGLQDLGAALLALGLLWGLNAGADVVQQRFLPELWAADRRITEAIAGGLGPGRIVLLGLSAGIGEEITLRGALQPRLGVLKTSAFFAALHVQYSWFGIGVIFMLGLLLGLVRKRTSTTAAILAHTAYDVLAVIGQ